MKLKKSGVVAISVCAVILAIVIALTVAVGVLHETIDMFVVGYKNAPMSEMDRAKGAALVEQIQEEGTVLVRNEKNVESDPKPVLPLNKDDVTRVNVFGWASVDWVYSGSGSGRVRATEENLTDLYEALDDYGVEYNEDLKAMYTDFKQRREHAEAFNEIDEGGTASDLYGNRGLGSLHSFSYEFSKLYEPDIDNYPADLLTDALDFSDTAIVVLGRITGESNDCPKVQYKQTTKNGETIVDRDRTYLEISTEEQKLLSYVGDSYSNVIVLINSTNVMELGFLETIDGLDACLLCMTTGTAGAKAIPSLLYGEKTVDILDNDGNATGETKTVKISPSGRTADTWAYDLTTNPTYVNTGAGVKSGSDCPYPWEDTTNFYTNSGSLYPMTVQHTNGSKDVNYTGVAYTDYAESIYVGYKWYETAFADGFWDDADVKTRFGIEGYQDVVQYPFGFGLSYTTFSWEVTRVHVPATVTENNEITIYVEVTNTGNAPGQDVVQLYYTPPFTAYDEENAVEKSAVNLIAFGKTQQVLVPQGQEDPSKGLVSSETVALTFNVEDMKSYDMSGEGGYLLEAGNYELSLRTDAHTVATDRVTNAGDATMTVNVASDITITEDSASHNEVRNLFTAGSNPLTDGVAIDGNSDGTAQIEYLHRGDFVNTFPYERKENREMSTEIMRLNLYTESMARAWDNAHSDVETYQYDQTSPGLVYENNAITDLGITLGKDFDAAEWEDVLNSANYDELYYLVQHGYNKTFPVNSIGKPATNDLDGPNQITSYNDQRNIGATGFSSIVLAQSWNLELSYSLALTLGREAVQNGITGWYGPGLNVHRSPFGGRNYEYYSEDAFLSGMMSAYSVAAAKNAGMYTFLKHLCLYESESGRDGMYNWLTEQSLREIYVKPFELAVKTHKIKDAEGNTIRVVGGSTAIMSSYGRIGAVWTGGSEALLTELVRDEWGFKGAILTDYADHREFMIGDQMLRAGGDLWMDGFDYTGNLKFNTNSAALKYNVRRASKNIIYMWLNALATNKEYNEKLANGTITEGAPIIPVPPELNFRWYIPVLVVVDVLAIGGCAVWLFFTFRKKKPQEASDETSAPKE